MVLLILSYIFLNPFANIEWVEKVDSYHEEVYAIMNTHSDSALAITDSALEIAEEADYQWGIANSYYIKGYIMTKIQNKPVAGLLMYLKAGHELENILDDKSVETYTSIMLNAGSILHTHGKNQEAIDLYEKALKKANLYFLENQEAKLLFNMAFAYRDKGDLSKALEIIESCIELSEKLENWKVYNDSWNLLGMILIDNQMMPEAKNCYLKIVKDHNTSPFVKANAYNNLGDMYFANKKFEQAISAYLNANQYHTIPEIKFDSYLGLTQVFQQSGDLVSALEYAGEAVHVFDSVVAGDQYLQIFNIMSQLYQQQGNQRLANFYSSRYFEETQAYFHAQKELIKIKNEFQVDLLLAGFYTEMEFEETEDKYANTIVFGITILLATILLVHLFYKRRMIASKEKIRKILDDYR